VTLDQFHRSCCLSNVLRWAQLPGIVFARGGAVAILMLLECEDQKYAVLTEQARVPVGRTILELPAGMLDDDDGDFVGTAAREVQCSILLSEILISYCI
jgi:hypothetical protein